MPCYHPSRVGIQRKSSVADARIFYTQVVPCGHCLGCRFEQSRQWMVRNMHESLMHRYAWFVTLTYDAKRLPENGSLRAEDLKRFFKHLREECGRFSYYAVGEYGEFSQRPHYHALLFGVEFLDCYPWVNNSGTEVWRSPTLERIWSAGLSELGSVTESSASYVTGYVRKKLRLRDNPNRFLRVDKTTGELFEVSPEFSRMSLRPAIGRRWIEKYWRDVYPRDFVVVNGIECKPPRYYDKFMDLEDEKGGSAERRAVMDVVREKRWNEWEESLKDRAFEEMFPEGRRHLRAVAATNKSRADLYDRRTTI